MNGQSPTKLLATAGMMALQMTLLDCGLAQAQTAAAGGVGSASPNAPPAQAENKPDTLAEIVVTATRRSQSLQDIPYNISAISGQSLQNSGVTSLNGLALAVPGLQNVDTGPNTAGGNNNFILRGLRTDGAGSGGDSPNSLRLSVSTVSTYLDETPVFFPLALKDIERVEVLKGPQGTLYGSGAEGGTIRIIANKPDFDRFSGSINVEGSDTGHSTHANYSVDGVINIPLASNVAVRVAAGEEHLGGFIDAVDLVQHQAPGNPLSPPVSRVPSDPLSGYSLAPVEHGVNNSEEWYVHAALRWRVSTAVDAQISYVHQRTGVDDLQAVNPTYQGGTFNWGYGGPLGNVDAIVNDPNATNTYRPGGKYSNTEDALSPSSDTLDLGNVLITADLGFATLTSSTSYNRVQAFESVASTPAIVIPDGAGSVASSAVFYAGFPRFTYFYNTFSRDEATTQEIRLVSNDRGRFNYVVGGYYQNEHYNYSGDLYVPGLNAFSPSANPQYGDEIFANPYDSNGYRFDHKALFGEFGYKITPQWQVTAGARFFWQTFESFGKSYFPWGGAPYSLTGTDPTGLGLNVDNSSSLSSHIKKLNTSYDFSPGLKVYATYSEGFRRGGANIVAPSGPYASLPQYESFAPDTAKNYEIGLKGTALEGKLRFDADVFVIDLDHFQFTNVTPAGYPIVLNGSTARSKGGELDAQFQPVRELTLSASYSYTSAKVRQGFSLQDYAIGGALTDPKTIITALSLPAGAKLPAVPANTFNLGADYAIRVGNGAAVNLHGDTSYKSSAPGTIDPTSFYYWTIPSTFFANARVTYDSGQQWSCDLFVNNLTNETAYTGGFGVQTIPSAFESRYVARPRTVGASLRYKF